MKVLDDLNWVRECFGPVYPFDDMILWVINEADTVRCQAGWYAFMRAATQRWMEVRHSETAREQAARKLKRCLSILANPHLRDLAFPEPGKVE